MSIINAKNQVPQHQRMYQAAYRQHTRVWQISPRSRLMLTPFLILTFGTLGANLYAGVRKVAGHNSWFSSD